MRKTKKKPKAKIRFLWIAATFFTLVFTTLLLFRIGFYPFQDRQQPLLNPETIPERDTWMNILQKGRKIGFSHSILSRQAAGYTIKEHLYLRIDMMGLVQDINLKTSGRLNADLTLSSFDFEINSSRFRFAAQGSISDNVLSIRTKDAGGTRKYTFPIERSPYLAAGLVDLAVGAALEKGQEITIDIFDPATMGQAPVVIRSLGVEEISYKGQMVKAQKVALNFKGAKQTAWIDSEGDILREKGILGITLEKTTQYDALHGLPIQSSQDLTKIASVASNVTIENPAQITELKIEIQDIEYDRVELNGGRQTFKDRVLTIKKERLRGAPGAELFAVDKENDEGFHRFLNPSPFIQSDHPKIRQKAREITSKEDPGFERIQKLITWIYKNIEKRPVFSVPDALATLENRIGDCNEHAVLMAALTRASGIAAKVEAGLVYLKGRFYYHAWNSVYLGKWITVDSLFGQIPADATHIRLVSGNQKQQLDLMHVIGKIRLKIIAYD